MGWGRPARATSTRRAAIVALELTATWPYNVVVLSMVFVPPCFQLGLEPLEIGLPALQTSFHPCPGWFEIHPCFAMRVVQHPVQVFQMLSLQPLQQTVQLGGVVGPTVRPFCCRFIPYHPFIIVGFMLIFDKISR